MRISREGTISSWTSLIYGVLICTESDYIYSGVKNDERLKNETEELVKTINPWAASLKIQHFLFAYYQL